MQERLPVRISRIVGILRLQIASPINKSFTGLIRKKQLHAFITIGRIPNRVSLYLRQSPIIFMIQVLFKKWLKNHF
ncbi:hypothetical protein D3C71_1936200 [compost metagenome]